jgi:hypothetical protein
MSWPDECLRCEDLDRTLWETIQELKQLDKHSAELQAQLDLIRSIMLSPQMTSQSKFDQIIDILGS